MSTPPPCQRRLPNSPSLYESRGDSDLSVYRVMDGRTVPDFHTVAEAMRDAVARLLTGPEDRNSVVFNCSFAVGPQLETLNASLSRLITAQHADDLDLSSGFDRAMTNRGQFSHFSAEVRELIDAGLLEPVPSSTPLRVRFTGEMIVVQELINFLNKRNILVVSAAGNDNCPHFSSRPLPRLPAAIEGVLRVSASNDGSTELAAYTNLDDFLNPDDGVTAIGGSVSNGLSTGGLIGLFVSEEVPRFLNVGMNGTRNSTGLAHWSGTSFATPVVAGLAACLRSEMSDPVTGAHAPAQDVLKGITNHWPALQLKQGGWHT